MIADSSASETTGLLRAWADGDERANGDERADGDERAMDDLTPRVYRQIRRLAGRYLQNEGPERTLQVSQVSDLIHDGRGQGIDIGQVSSDPMMRDWRLKAGTSQDSKKASIGGRYCFLRIRALNSRR